MTSVCLSLKIKVKLFIFQMVLKKILAFFVYKGIVQKISDSLTIKNAARLTAQIYFRGKQVSCDDRIQVQS